jgi:hypothetical protein
VGCGGQPELLRGVDGDLVVAAALVLEEGCRASDLVAGRLCQS